MMTAVHSLTARAPSGVATVGASRTIDRASRASSARGASLRRRASDRGGSLVANAFTPAGARVAGVGMAIPKQYLTNEDLSELVETNDEWIRTRTGIGKRHVISGDETLTSLAAEASNKALEMAGIEAKDVDLIILATSSPDDLFGSACTVRHLSLATTHGQSRARIVS